MIASERIAQQERCRLKDGTLQAGRVETAVLVWQAVYGLLTQKDWQTKSKSEVQYMCM